jgi:hypothetical protein
MSSQYYTLIYKTSVSFGTSDDHDSALVEAKLVVLAGGIEEAISMSKKALKGLQRDNNGKNYPFINTAYELVSVEKNRI